MAVVVSDKDKSSDEAALAGDELLRLTYAQYQAIVDDDIDRLNQLIAERDILMQALGLTSSSFSDDGSANTTGNDPVQSLGAIDLANLLDIDTKTREALKNRLAETKSRLVAINRGYRALQGYSYLRPLLEPMYIDRKG